MESLSIAVINFVPLDKRAYTLSNNGLRATVGLGSRTALVT